MKKTIVDSFIFSEVPQCWASPAMPFKVTKLWNQKSINSIPRQHRVEHVLQVSALSFQPTRSSACGQNEWMNEWMKNAPLVRVMPRWMLKFEHVMLVGFIFSYQHSNIICKYTGFLYSNQQCSALVMQSEANQCSPQLNWACLQCLAQHTHTTSEIASIACLHDFSGPALLSCSKFLTYQLLGSQLWTVLPLEKSRSPATVNKVGKSRHNSRTKLCIKLSLVHIRDNTEFYLHCKFQTLPFSVRRKNGVTDRLNDWMNRLHETLGVLHIVELAP